MSCHASLPVVLSTGGTMPHLHRWFQFGSDERKTLSQPLHAQDLAAVDPASMYAVADALALMQSAVSKRGQALERRLGPESIRAAVFTPRACAVRIPAWRRSRIWTTPGAIDEGSRGPA